MSLPRLQAVAALSSLFALVACGGGSDSSSTPPAPPPTTYTAASGVAQKGPFAMGSAVTLQELGLNLAPTGPSHAATTDSDLGTFAPGTSFATPYIGVTASGYYHDEITDLTSSGPATLQSYADLSVDTTLNANVLTTLAYGRIDVLVNQHGLAFAAARTQAEGEVLAAFGIAPGATGGTHFGALDIADAGASGTATDGDRILAALSAVFVQGRSAADAGALIAAAQADLAANGAITDPATRAAIAASEQALDVDRAAANLDKLYASVGATLPAAGLAEWLDRDGDGVIEHDSFTGIDAASFTLPAEFVAAHAGASVTVSAGGTLWVNGAPASTPAMLAATDVVAIAQAATPPPGVFKAYLQAGSTPIARVAFVNGLAAITVAPASGTVPAGLGQRYTALGSFSDGHSEDLAGVTAWSSATPATADIDAGTGQADALALGTTTITASVGSVSASTGLSVVAAAIASISIAPSSLETGVGIARSLVATGTFSDGSTAIVNGTVQWSSLAPATATVRNGLVTGVAVGSTTITASSGDVSSSVTVDVTADSWTSALSMPTGRVAGATATTLADGTLLVIGGATNDGSATAAVDLYDFVTRRWLPAGTRAPMATARASHTATLLADGRVLVCGGATPSATAGQGYVNNTSVEIYDPAKNTWTPAAPMAGARSHHTATLLPDGRVLVAGGEDEHYLPVATAELYDPVAGTWTSTAQQLVGAREGHTATLLANGRVLLAGGHDFENSVLTPLASAEVFDPLSATFALTGAAFFAHDGHTATRLPSGLVLVAAGGTAQSELYDPATGRWEATPSLVAAPAGQAAVLLPTGQVLVAGGTTSEPNAERYDIAAGRWFAAASMSVNRLAPIAAVLPDGSALVCGGGADAASTSCEVYW